MQRSSFEKRCREVAQEACIAFSLIALYNALDGFTEEDKTRRFWVTLGVASAFLALKEVKEAVNAGDMRMQVVATRVGRHAVTPLGIISLAGYGYDVYSPELLTKLGDIDTWPPLWVKVFSLTALWTLKNSLTFACGWSESQSKAEELSHFLVVWGLQVVFCAAFANSNATLGNPGVDAAVTTVSVFLTLLLADAPARLASGLSCMPCFQAASQDDEKQALLSENDPPRRRVLTAVSSEESGGLGV